MKVLVACEYSGIVRDAFLKRGHNAISCDILPSESNLGKHYQGDVRDILDDDWDLMIAHPPCTYLSVSGARWFYHPEDKHLDFKDRRPHPLHPNRKKLQEEALEFVQLLLNAPIEKIALENPVSVISTKIRKPDQIIQPYQFGHETAKTTCLWFKNLKPLKPTNIVEPIWITSKSGNRFNKLHYDTYLLPQKKRGKVRSATFPGIAEAMAEQWGDN
jgi:site-specific DNA-cytosine methylase